MTVGGQPPPDGTGDQPQQDPIARFADSRLSYQVAEGAAGPGYGQQPAQYWPGGSAGGYGPPVRRNRLAIAIVVIASVVLALVVVLH